MKVPVQRKILDIKSFNIFFIKSDAKVRAKANTKIIILKNILSSFKCLKMHRKTWQKFWP